MPPVSHSNPGRSERTAGQQHLNGLTGLRFFLALHVVVHHAYFNTPDAWIWSVLPSALFSVMMAGHLAPSVFFILSGFILTYTYLGEGVGNIDRPTFWRARFARIYPVYVVSLLVAAPWFFRNAPVDQSITGGILVALMLQAWAPPFATAWNGPAWTLSVEAFFYLLFPFLAPRIVAMSGRRMALLGAVLIVVLIAAPLSLKATFGVTGITMPPLRLGEFVVGVLLGEAFRRGQHARAFFERERSATITLQTVAVLAVLAAYGSLGPDLHVEWFGALIPVHALLVFSLALGAPSRHVSTWKRGLLLLGEASYALYLMHGPVWQVLGYIMTKMGLSDRTGELWFIMGSILLVVVVSVFVFLGVERPCRRLLRGRPRVGTAAHRTLPLVVPSPVASAEIQRS